jgi:ribonuclease P protein component
MLQRKFRLSRGADIKRTLKGHQVRGGYFSIRFSRNGINEPRFGFIASVKVAKKATRRNRLKRRTREIIKKNIKNIKKGYDVLFIFSKQALELSFSELEGEIFKKLLEANLLTRETF